MNTCSSLKQRAAQGLYFLHSWQGSSFIRADTFLLSFCPLHDEYTRNIGELRSPALAHSEHREDKN